MRQFKYNLDVIEYQATRYISANSLLITSYKALENAETDEEKNLIKMFINWIENVNNIKIV